MISREDLVQLFRDEGNNSFKQDNSSVTADELRNTYRNRLQYLHGIPANKVEKMSRDQIQDVLFPEESQRSAVLPPIISFFNREECRGYSNKKIRSLSLKTGTPIPAQISSETFREIQCKLLEKSIYREYHTDENPSFNVSVALEQIKKGTGIPIQPHQIKVASYLLKNRGLLAIHRTGSGKTFTAILSILLLKTKYPGLRIVVLVPSSLKENFTEQMIKFGISPLGVRMMTALGSSSKPPVFTRLVVELYSFDEYHSFFKQSEKVSPLLKQTFFIIDEAHHLRSEIKLNRQQEILQAQKTYSIMMTASQAFRVLLLSATPIINSEYDLANLFAMVIGIPPTPSRLLTRKQFRDLVAQPDQFQQYAKCKVSYYFPENTTDYPTVINMPLVVFTMNAYYYEKYKEIESRLNYERHESFYRSLRMAEIALDGEYSPKVDWVVDFVTREAAAGRKSVVFSNWIYAGIHLIRRRLDLMNKPESRYVPIIGDISTEDRQRFKDLYNSGIANIMLISKAGSEGLDLTNTRNVIILESNWNPSVDLQIIGRAVRYKSHESLPLEERNVRVWRLLMRKPLNTGDTLRSIDEELYSLSYEVKLPMMKQLGAMLQKASIEENDCTSLSSIAATELAEELEKLTFASPREKPVYKEFEYEYVAPETSALAKPPTLTDEQYAKIAGLIAPKEDVSSLVDRLKATQEQAQTRQILPILIDEDEWE